MNLVDHYTAMFVDVSKQRFARAWKFFLLGEKEDLGKAQCQLCKKHLKCNGSTKGLNDHLKAFHTKEFEPKLNIEEKTPKKSSRPNQQKLDGFINKERKSRDEVVSRLALDGVSFHCISKSSIMREAFHAYGTDLPRSKTAGI